MEYWEMPADWSEEYLQTFEPVLHSENQQKMRECSDENLEFMLGKDTSIQGQLEMNELLEKLYSVLTPRQKKTLELFLEQSDSIKELAKLEGRCKSKYYRDRQAIQKKYQEYIRGGELNG